jgi:hypothetical protein
MLGHGIQLVCATCTKSVFFSSGKKYLDDVGQTFSAKIRESISTEIVVLGEIRDIQAKTNM